MKAVIERCGGIDVAKKILNVCALTGGADQEPEAELGKYGSFNADLDRLREWLVSKGCTHVVMESTGSYWKPVYAALEGSGIQVLLANGEDVKARRGHKTDWNDCQFLAHLLRHGMIRPSFIPPQAIRDLRDLTRRRRQLIGAATSERNRVQKILEEANIKLGSVLSDIFGVSGQLMLEKLLEGEADLAAIANLARKKARLKIPEIHSLRPESATHYGKSAAAPEFNKSIGTNPADYPPPSPNISFPERTRQTGSGLFSEEPRFSSKSGGECTDEHESGARMLAPPGVRHAESTTSVIVTNAQILHRSSCPIRRRADSTERPKENYRPTKRRDRSTPRHSANPPGEPSPKGRER